jgi:hypothetical protein
MVEISTALPAVKIPIKRICSPEKEIWYVLPMSEVKKEEKNKNKEIVI